VKAAYPEAAWIDLLDSEVHRYYEARPERLREVAAPLVVIDEIQRVPALLDMVHLLIEERSGLRFVLTGSSARKLHRSGVDLLAGRAVLRRMHPFMAAELAGEFDLNRALTQGLLPVVWSSPKPADTLRTYAGIYLREEVQMEGLVRRMDAFARLLEVASFSHGGVLNVAEVARECQVSRKGAESYFDILDDLMLSFRLPIFTRRARRELVAHPKFYYLDAGVFQSVRPRGPLDRPEELAGGALEGLVAQHVRAWIDYSGADARLYYWRTKAGVEVDFVVYGSAGFWAIEVKHGHSVNPGDVRGLEHFGEDYPEAERVLVYMGTVRLKVRGIDCVPVDAFLRSIVPGQPLFGG
jgi:predicted AAA+ superfamily ATPase